MNYFRLRISALFQHQFISCVFTESEVMIASVHLQFLDVEDEI